MTIKGLWLYYKKNIDYDELPVSALRGKAVAIDIYGEMYATRSVSKGIYMRSINPFCDQIDDEEIDRKWIPHYFKLVLGYLQDGFIPIFVYDGPKVDPLKEDTLIERTNKTKKIIKEIKSILDKYEDSDLLAIPAKATDTLRTLNSQVNIMPKDSVKRFYEFFYNIGIPWVKCNGEGERTCALMARDGIVDYIICDDSDILPCGANVTILKEKCQIYTKGHGDKGYLTAHLDKMLNDLNMDFDLFQELCIMSGTDFNKNIKGIGWKRAADLLIEHGSISYVGKNTKHDISILNHREVRKRFALIPWEQTVEDYSLDITLDEKRDLLALGKYDLASYIIELIRLKKKLIELQNKKLDNKLEYKLDDDKLDDDKLDDDKLDDK